MVVSTHGELVVSVKQSIFEFVANTLPRSAFPGAIFINKMLWYTEHGKTVDDERFGNGWRIMSPDEWYEQTLTDAKQRKKICDAFDFLECESHYSTINSESHKRKDGKARKFLWYRINIEKYYEQFNEWAKSQNEKCTSARGGKCIHLPVGANVPIVEEVVEETIPSDETDDVTEKPKPKKRTRKPDVQFDAIKHELESRKKAFTPALIGKLKKCMKQHKVDEPDYQSFFRWLDKNKTNVNINGSNWSWSAKNMCSYVTDWLDWLNLAKKSTQPYQPPKPAPKPKTMDESERLAALELARMEREKLKGNNDG